MGQNCHFPQKTGSFKFHIDIPSAYIAFDFRNAFKSLELQPFKIGFRISLFLCFITKIWFEKDLIIRAFKNLVFSDILAIYFKIFTMVKFKYVGLYNRYFFSIYPFIFHSYPKCQYLKVSIKKCKFPVWGDIKWTPLEDSIT